MSASAHTSESTRILDKRHSTPEPAALVGIWKGAIETQYQRVYPKTVL